MTNYGPPVHSRNFVSITMATKPRSTPKTKRLLFFSQNGLPFVKQDEDILKKHFDLKPFHLKNYNTIPTALLTYVKVLFWLLVNIRQCDGLFLRFADVYGFFFAIFARLFRKKLFVVVGGFDATWIPDLKYGTYHNKRSRFFSWFTLKTACKNLPVSKSLVYDPGNHLGLNLPKQGIKYFYPDIASEKIIVVPNGYNASIFKPNDQIERTNSILMVGNIKFFQTFKVKGVDTFIKLAEATPQLDFTLIGADSQLLKQWIDLPSNFTAVPQVDHHELPHFYQSAKVFMCLSISEGMPNVLSEAMLCECIPVGFNIGSVQEIIGETGVILESMDINQIKSGLFKALEMDGQPARKKIMTHYPVEAREKNLVQIIESELSC